MNDSTYANFKSSQVHAGKNKNTPLPNHHEVALIDPANLNHDLFVIDEDFFDQVILPGLRSYWNDALDELADRGECIV